MLNMCVTLEEISADAETATSAELHYTNKKSMVKIEEVCIG
jgi:copper(I)-binding protein